MSLLSLTQILDQIHQTLDPSPIIDDEARRAFQQDEVNIQTEQQQHPPSPLAPSSRPSSTGALLDGPSTVSMTGRDTTPSVATAAPSVRTSPSSSRLRPSKSSIRPNASVKTATSKTSNASVKTAGLATSPSTRTAPAPTSMSSSSRKRDGQSVKIAHSTKSAAVSKNFNPSSMASSSAPPSTSYDDSGSRSRPPPPSVTATPSLTTAPSMTTATSFATQYTPDISMASSFQGSTAPPIRTIRTRNHLVQQRGSAGGVVGGPMPTVSRLSSNKSAAGASLNSRRFGGPDRNRLSYATPEQKDERRESRSNDNYYSKNTPPSSPKRDAPRLDSPPSSPPPPSSSPSSEQIIDLSHYDPQGPYDGLLERVAVMTGHMERMLNEFEQMRSENVMLLESLQMAGDSARMQLDYCDEETKKY